jgi:S-DNA-T family DNA segregation ATPase FtsK/SpoIIIE
MKKDIIGGLLAVVGVLSLIGFLTGDKGLVTGWFSHLLRLIGGWGGICLPIVILAAGLWILFRNVEKFPRLSPGRAFGLFLLYFNLLTWFHYSLGGGYATAALGQGGGYLGAFFTDILIRGLGKAGTVVFLIAWDLVALLFVVDLSLPDLAEKISSLFDHPAQVKTKPVQTPAPKTAVPIRQQTFHSSPMQELPEGFNPLDLGEDESAQPVQRPAPRKIEVPQGETKSQPTTTAAANKSSSEPLVVTPTKVTQPAKPWPMPVVEAILDPATQVMIQGQVDKDRARIIEDTLASFNAPAHVVEIHRGPTVTQFGVEPDYIETRNGKIRVRVAKIVNLTDDLAMALAAPSIRIEAPVPGHSYVGLEVPNKEITVVGLREVMESDPYSKQKSTLRLALGKDVAGKPVCADLTTMPHLLIAGTTNSGKSVCVNSILCSLLLSNSPADMRLVLVDPKRVELTGYNQIPHLLAPVVVDADQVVGALQWVIREMDVRYHTFAKMGVRNIAEYNRRSEDHLPFLVVVIDELADLMMLAPDDTERCITRLTQLARATGIHLIVATQRPSVDVVTGLIKANMPARISFMVSSSVDSRVILDQPGAEKLLGRGDMLYQAPDAPAPVRLQGTYVSDNEILRLVESWKTIAFNYDRGEETDPFSNASFEMMTSSTPLKQGSFWEEGSEGKGKPSIVDQAIEVVRREKKASISLLQRKMGIGYARAARIIDELEEREIVGPQTTTSQVREVLDYGDADSEEPDDSETE